jgi:voltage-gated potassium channel
VTGTFDILGGNERREPELPANESSRTELANTGYELFVGALSVLSLVNIVLALLLRDEALQTVVRVIDVLLSVVFLIDFLARLRRAPSRRDYVFRQFGWADLLASLPFPQFKILRVFRLFRVARLLRRLGAGNIGRGLIRDRAGSALMSLLLIGVLVLEFGSLAMLALEQKAPGANITTASDALWYVIVTMATVGYGDQYPVTTGGREMGTLVIIIGVGIFGTLTGYLANLFLAPRSEEPQAAVSLSQDPRLQLHQLKALVEQQRVAVDQLARAIEDG